MRFCICGASLNSIASVFLFVYLNHQAYADEIENKDAIAFEELEVIGTSMGVSALDLPASVTVIDSVEIENSGASTILDVLSGKANLNLQSFSGGTGKDANIDIRGMGATALNNVLLLIDGERLNNDDLAGADYSNISLETIERIEIIRGGGNVRYGNGATGGVINIITRSPEQDGFSSKVHFQAGSFNLRDLRTSIYYQKNKFSLAANASELRNDGFRDNGGLERTTINSKMNYQINDDINVYSRIALIDDEAGRPGNVTLNDFNGTTSTRQSAQNLLDFINTEEKRFTLGFTHDNSNSGKLKLQAGLRERKNPFTIGFSRDKVLAEEIGQNQYKTISSNLTYQNQFSALARSNDVYLGFEFQQSDFLRRENGTAEVDKSTRKEGEIISGALLGELTTEITSNLSLLTGYRLERYSIRQANKTLRKIINNKCDTKTTTVFIPFPVVSTEFINCETQFIADNNNNNHWYNHAADIGLNWHFTDQSRFYARVSRNFRSPNVEELVQASTDIGPQTGLSKEVGFRFTANRGFDLAFSLFSLNIENEIVFIFDPILLEGLNLNLDSKTERHGFELELNYPVTEKLFISSSMGYVRPKLLDRDVDIPLVPRVTASSSIEYSITPKTSFQLRVNHVSKRIDGNNFITDEFPTLKPYTVFDLYANHQHNDFRVFAGIRNLSNEIYSTIAYSATYYPMPERNAFAGFTYTF